MSKYLNDPDYCLLIGRMVYHEVRWNWTPNFNLFGEDCFWINAMTQRYHECQLEAYGCLDADL